MSLNLSFNLVPPDPNSLQTGVQVVDSKGVPLGAKGEDAGTVIAKQLGWAANDTIEPAVADQINQIVKDYGNVNISVQVTGGANGDPITLQFNSLDPSKPAPPINQNYLIISQNSISQTTATTGSQTTATAGTKALGEHKPNPWLAGNVFVAYLECFMEMQRMLKQSKMVEGGIEVKMMNAVVELAKAEADAIMQIAKQQRDQYIAAACMAGVSVVISTVSLGMTAVSMARVRVGAFPEEAPPKTGDPVKDADFAKGYDARKSAWDSAPNPKGKGGWSVNSANASISFWGGVSASAQSLNSMGTNIAQAVTAVPIAQLEGLKTLLQAYKQMMQHILEKASDKFKQDSDQISQLLSTLDSILQKVQDALAGMLRK